MSEVLTRLDRHHKLHAAAGIIALLLFGGSTLKDFAFALLIGVASGAYSSIFIASPVLMHWKEREPVYRGRRQRIIAELGMVPAYASDGADVEPARKRSLRGVGRLTTPEPETVSAAEFEQLKRDIAGGEEAEPFAPHLDAHQALSRATAKTEEEVEREATEHEEDVERGNEDRARSPRS